MKVRSEYIASFYLLIGTILLAIIQIDAFPCPEHCTCVDVQRKRYNYNHAKCTSLDGLRQLGKTSELHSLDLSSLNLTKINNQQLDKLTNLTKLDLTDNRLSEINSLGTKRIRILNLSHNRITSGKLAKIPSTVKHLNLSHNDITVLPENFKHFIHLKSLELADNPLNCTCETLDVRNWLQEHKVWTEKPIRCATPLQFKGWSWLQIRQSEVCDPNGLETPRMLPFSDVTDDENDLMLGDDPNVHRNDEFDGIDHDFLPVSFETKNRKKRGDNDDSYNSYDDDGEGSGDDGQSLPSSSSDVITELYEGSGDEFNESSPSAPIILNDDDQTSTEPTLLSNDAILMNAPVSSESNEVIDSNENASIENGNENETIAPVTEETIVPINANNDVEQIPNSDGTETSKSNRIAEQVHESKSTYILLGILGVLLIALILYVATKRSRANIKNRRNNNDIEGNAQELSTMDKNNLGKPIPKPMEFIPLIPEKHALDAKTNGDHRCNGDEPLLQKLNEADNENDTTDHTTKVSDNQQLNGNAKPVQNGGHPDNNDQQQFQPISPKPSRYSPVNILTFFSFFVPIIL